MYSFKTFEEQRDICWLISLKIKPGGINTDLLGLFTFFHPLQQQQQQSLLFTPFLTISITFF